MERTERFGKADRHGYILRAHCAPGTKLIAGDIRENRALSLSFRSSQSGVEGRKETGNYQMKC